MIGLRRELTALARACGEVHPALIPLQRLALVENGYRIRDLQEIVDYPAGMGQISADLRTALIDQMAPLFDDRLRQPTARVS